MNRILLFALLFLLPWFLKGQDTIVKRSGEKIVVKVQEVAPGTISYSRFDYQNGPIFILPKQEISCMIYANGLRESYENYIPRSVLFTKALDLSIQVDKGNYYYTGVMLNEKGMLLVADGLNDKKIKLMISKVEGRQLFQNVCTFASISLFVSGLFVYAAHSPIEERKGAGLYATATITRGQKTGELMMLAGLATEVFSISFMISRTHYAHIVVGAYNQVVLR